MLARAFGMVSKRLASEATGKSCPSRIRKRSMRPAGLISGHSRGEIVWAAVSSQWQDDSALL